MAVHSRVEKQTVPVRKKAYEHLKTAILSGRLSPKERLTEEHLAETLGVSRTPVREALYKLEAEGLIRPLKTRGFIVSGDSKEEVKELFELRAILEGYALRIISEKITREGLQHLGTFIDKAQAALEANRMGDVFKWNTRFHDYLHELVSDSIRLYRLIVDMRKQVLRHRKVTLQSIEGAQRTLDGHQKILLALRLKDPELCEKTMREHIKLAKEDALLTLLGEHIE
ncbi:MAG: GntR family transcriptional regulator [Dehalococcoidia bacterium]|nr:MAG: GntR family transcriptional regulator [Dehalococcoidia bacterium]